MNDDFAMPKGLSEDGQKAWKAILTLLLTDDPQMSTGGCKVFYSPEEWRARGEQYGRESELVIAYDGGDHRPYFTLDAECYDMVERMNGMLSPLGLYTEECIGWYAAVYKS
jgi:hypothetical protein